MHDFTSGFLSLFPKHENKYTGTVHKHRTYNL